PGKADPEWRTDLSSLLDHMVTEPEVTYLSETYSSLVRGEARRLAGQLEERLHLLVSLDLADHPLPIGGAVAAVGFMEPEEIFSKWAQSDQVVVSLRAMQMLFDILWEEAPRRAVDDDGITE